VNYSKDFVVSIGSIETTEERYSLRQFVGMVYTNIPAKLEIESRTSKTFYFITAILTNLECIGCDLRRMVNETVSLYLDGVGMQEKLLKTHKQAWLELWKSRFEIGGNMELEKAIRSSLYYILSSIREDWFYPPSPGGLATDAYNGHIFWDAEIWMYPTIALLFPRFAESFLKYRFLRMEEAKVNAKSFVPPCEGTSYPWESAFVGNETAPRWVRNEIHINGAISFAIQQYWRLTKDIYWLEIYGWPMLRGIAEFWASKVKQNGENEFIIENVIPPDEYSTGITNSVYTNSIASLSLQFAYSAGKLLNENVPEKWMEISKKLKIPYDEKNQIHPEYDGYSGKTIKQADAILLGFPLMIPMSKEVRYNDLVYYSERTDSSGPAMTWGMHSVGWTEVGEMEKAESSFMKSYENIKEPFHVWTEFPSGGAVNFITGAGGFLQSIWGGFLGLRIEDEKLSFNPVLPSFMTSVKINKIQYLGNSIDVYYNSTNVEVYVLKEEMRSYLLLTNSEETIPIGNEIINFKLERFSIHVQQ